MPDKFLPFITAEGLQHAQSTENDDNVFELLVMPLHEELYKRQSFDFMDDLTWGQQLLLSLDYARMQVGQGGFIQFIENGYIYLLTPMPEWLNNIGAIDMAQVIDDVLKVYVLNRELLDRKNTVEEFANLYNEFKEFEIIDGRFALAYADTVKKLMQYASANPTEFYITAP